MKLTTRRTLLVAGAVAASIFFATVLARGRTSRSEPLSDRVPNAAVAVARRTSLRSTLTLSGEFKPFQEVDLHAKVAGYIRRISVDVGDRVRTGQVLAVLEMPELVRSCRRLALRSTAPDRRTRRRTRPTRALKQVSERRPGLIAAAGARRRPRPRQGSRSARRADGSESASVRHERILADRRRRSRA